MRKLLFTFLIISTSVTIAYSQSLKKKTLFIIDSITIVQDAQSWNKLYDEDISDMRVLHDRDSLKLLGRSDYDEVAFIFTKAYRNRPDSIKRIPTLKQMEFIDDVWNLNGMPYTGRYIDYYNSGKIQNAGYLLRGKLDGQITTFFKNGMKESTTVFENGVPHGVRNTYYKNGVLRETRNIKFGEDACGVKTYFINGQVEYELICGERNAMDTSISYFSSGKVKEIELISSDGVISSKKPSKLGYYNAMFIQSLAKGDLKKANKYFKEIAFIDGLSVDTKLKEGILRFKESRYDEAIALLDKVLEIEPYTRDALVFRGLARIKKYRAIPENSLSGAGSVIPITIEDMEKIPADELRKVCVDLLKADEIAPDEAFAKKYISEAILEFCRK